MIFQILTTLRRYTSVFTTTAVILYLSYLNLFLILNTDKNKVNETFTETPNPFVFEINIPINKTVVWCKKQHKLPLSSSKLAALASFPGSGNTWLRYLLQQATGICTGSIYIDIELEGLGYAEGVADASCLVIKIHDYEHWYNKVDMFDSAIVLLRNPRDALMAQFNWESGGHLGFAQKAHYDYIDWDSYVTVELNRWDELYSMYLSAFPGPMHIVFYETLVNDTRNTLQGILNFLNVTITEDDMRCVMSNKNGIFMRNKRNVTYDPYTADMYERMNKVKDKIYKEAYLYMNKMKNTNAAPLNSLISSEIRLTSECNALSKIS